MRARQQSALKTRDQGDDIRSETQIRNHVRDHQTLVISYLDTFAKGIFKKPPNESLVIS